MKTDTTTTAGGPSAQLTVALPATLIAEIAEAVAERLREGDLVPARSLGSTSRAPPTTCA